MTDRKHSRSEGAKRKIPVNPVGEQEEAAEAASVETEVVAADEVSADEVPADEIAAVAAERDEYLDHLRRLQAEFDNYRKRVRRDQEDLRLRAAEAVVESLLPVMDNLARPRGGRAP